MIEARNFKFGTQIVLGKSHLKHDKIPPKRGVIRPRAGEFLNFGTAGIYLDRVKLDTCNFTNCCNAVSTIANG